VVVVRRLVAKMVGVSPRLKRSPTIAYPPTLQAMHRGPVRGYFFWIDRKKSILIVNFLNRIQEKSMGRKVGRHASQS